MSLTLPAGDDWIVLIDWEIDAGTTLRLSSRTYCTRPTDTPANTEYKACITSIPWNLAASCVLHRSGDGASPITQIAFDNASRALDTLIHTPLRDTPISIKFVSAGNGVDPPGAYADAVEVATAYGDRVVSATATQIAVKLRSVMDRMRQPMSEAWILGDSAGSNKIVTLGDVAYTDGQPYSDADRVVAVNDRPWWGVTSVWAGGVNETDYERSIDVAVEGIDFGAVTERKTLGVSGSVWNRIQRLENTQFANWTAGAPDDWVVTQSSPTSTVTRVGTSNAVSIYSSGPAASIAQTVLTIGELYSVQVVCTTVIAGALQVVNGSTELLTIDRPGAFRTSFTATATDFTIRASLLEATSEVRLSSASCYDVEKTNRIDNLVYHLLRDRMLFDPAVADSASVDALAVAAPWTLGTQIDGQQDVYTTLQQALDNCCAAAWSDLRQIIHVGQLRNPSEETAVANFSASSIIDGVTVRQDEAPGLRTRIRHSQNFSVYTDNDLVTSDAGRRTLLKTPFYTVSSTTSPSAHYSQPVLGEPRQSWIRDAGQAQDQLDAEIALFSEASPALMVDFASAINPEIGLDLQPFDCIAVQYDAPGFDYARKCLVLAVGGDLLVPQRVNVLAWSPSQPATLLLDDGGSLLTDDGGGIAITGD